MGFYFSYFLFVYFSTPSFLYFLSLVIVGSVKQSKKTAGSHEEKKLTKTTQWNRLLFFFLFFKKNKT